MVTIQCEAAVRDENGAGGREFDTIAAKVSGLTLSGLLNFHTTQHAASIPHWFLTANDRLYSNRLL